VDEILSVSTDEAERIARRLAREEALFAGTSSGGNVVAAICVAERLGSRGQSCHTDGGLWFEISEHRRVQQEITNGPITGALLAEDFP
jgi:cysteine synthase